MIPRLFSIALLVPLSAYAQSVTVEVPPHTTTSVTIQSAPIPDDADQVDPKDGKCGMAAGLIRAMANEKESGTSKKQQLKVMGNTNFTRYWLDRVYSAPKSMTPQDMHDAVYADCMRQSN